MATCLLAACGTDSDSVAEPAATTAGPSQPLPDVVLRSSGYVARANGVEATVLITTPNPETVGKDVTVAVVLRDESGDPISGSKSEIKTSFDWVNQELALTASLDVDPDELGQDDASALLEVGVEAAGKTAESRASYPTLEAASIETAEGTATLGFRYLDSDGAEAPMAAAYGVVCFDQMHRIIGGGPITPQSDPDGGAYANGTIAVAAMPVWCEALPHY